MSGGITVKEFKHIPGVNDAEYIKKLEELQEIDKRIISKAVAKIKMLSAQPDTSKYEYHYDHTDCIWYGDGSNKCPSTCSQYRDGWNDAMQYIFGNGKGYKPYRRDGHHE